jgi:hypothetical protein
MSGRWLPSTVILRALNRLFIRYLGTGLPAGPNVLLTVRGRTTGRCYTNLVALFRTHGRRFVLGRRFETRCPAPSSSSTAAA